MPNSTQIGMNAGCYAFLINREPKNIQVLNLKRNISSLRVNIYISMSMWCFCFKLRAVDKAVMVTKADLMEPRDKFHRAGEGTKKGILDEDEIPFKPNLEAIREDSCESRSSDEEHSR